MMSIKYKKRVRGGPLEEVKQGEEGANKDKEFSALFVGQWEKQESWKYTDIWHLIKYGIPSELRGNLWKDLIKAQVHEQQSFLYFNG